MHENLKGYVNTFAYIYAIIFNTIKNTQDRYPHKYTEATKYKPTS